MLPDRQWRIDCTQSTSQLILKKIIPRLIMPVFWQKSRHDCHESQMDESVHWCQMVAMTWIQGSVGEEAVEKEAYGVGVVERIELCFAGGSRGGGVEKRGKFGDGGEEGEERWVDTC